MGNNTGKVESDVVTITSDLANATLSNTPKFDTGVANKRMIGKVVEVVDGDTLSVALRVNGGIYWHRVRLFGIDTPELHPKKIHDDEWETEEERLVLEQARVNIITAAQRATEYTTKLVANTLVVLDCKIFDNFGRLIAKVYVPRTPVKAGSELDLMKVDDMINLSDKLLSKGHAVPFKTSNDRV